MARILIFVGSRAAIEKYEAAGVPIYVPAYRTRMGKILQAFSADPNGQLAFHAYGMVEGWRVPNDTFVVFRFVLALAARSPLHYPS